MLFTGKHDPIIKASEYMATRKANQMRYRTILPEMLTSFANLVEAVETFLPYDENTTSDPRIASALSKFLLLMGEEGLCDYG